MKKALLCFMIIGIAVLLLAQTKEQNKILDRKVTCPLCGFSFKAHIVMNPDTRGGEDTDFLIRSVGSNPIANTVWTCPKCYYSALPQDFQKKLPETVKKELFKTKDFGKDLSTIAQDDIPAWLKYENAIIFYETLGQETQFIAGLHLKAAWACRLDAIEYTPEMDKLGQEYWDKVIKFQETTFQQYFHDMAELISQQMENHLDSSKKSAVLELVYADYRRKSGDYLAALQILQNMKKQPATYNTFKSQIDNDILLCEKEKTHQQEALTLFEKELQQDKITKDYKIRFTYLAGELSRRLGKKKQAQDWYQKALELIPEDQTFRLLVEQQLKFVRQ
ncbi:MAG: hypothetical protein A2Y62_17860 [Candidatus Fischerbacteria bacterium RBG_13_37_8]|uniref:Uncharacterized protein n=1 Tax=Candidatus Fischerbacteria bacterium RBG_13_37_8 TaxID=1817863 RepID=A0A1F5VPA2_9BACT|nr:MAG: hypothetical protein A2Y62_17860 [Candidatus Fischerbacteria bacterium RBG_13_37_8]